ncbi:MAG TPA: hypothetical protein PLV42_09250 [bacterium]|nr:hypothetical protein [bacterium]
MKNLLVGLMLLTTIAYGVENSPAMNRRIEALAIGETTLAYRLVALSASLAIAAATDNDAILALLENVESTLSNGKSFLAEQNTSSAYSKEIAALIDSVLSCSVNVKQYTKNKNYDNLQKIRGCIDPLEGKINDLTERFNKTTPAPVK